MTSDQHLINMALIVAMHLDDLSPFLKCDNFSVRDVRGYLSRISALQIVRQVQHLLIDGISHLSIYLFNLSKWLSALLSQVLPLPFRELVRKICTTISALKRFEMHVRGLQQLD